MSEPVTMAECNRKHGQVLDELHTIKDALIGRDMRGGIVNDLGAIKGELKSLKDSEIIGLKKEIQDLKNSNGNSRKRSKKEVAVQVAAYGFIAAIIVEGIRLLGTVIQSLG